MEFNKSKTIFKEAKKYIPGGVNSPVRSFQAVGGTPPFIVRGKGSKIYDMDGGEYIDYVLSYGPLILGHSHPSVISQVIKTAQKGTSFGAPTENEVKLAKVITNILPSMEQIRFVNSGTEATMSAIRLARGYTKRKYIVKFIGCYHGHHDSLLVNSPTKIFGEKERNSGITEETYATTLTLPFNNLSALKTLFREKGKEIAALIVEPTPGNMGLILPQEHFLSSLRSLTKQYGVLLIFDEVMSGFRSSLGGSQQLYDIDPDLTCLGKVIGGGMPVAAFGGKKDIMQLLAPVGPVYQAGTLSGNPLAMIAGLETLDYVVKNNVCENLTKTASFLKEELIHLGEKYNIPLKVHQVGSMFSIFFSDRELHCYEDVLNINQAAFKFYFHAMLNAGIYLPPSPYETCFISSEHTKEDFSSTLVATEKAFFDIKNRRLV